MKTYMLPPKPKVVKARLHLNENPFPPPERVVNAVLEAAKKGNLYPDPERLWKLREEAAKYYGLPGPEWVLPTLGSDTALRLSFECCALMGKARLPYPSFQAYPPLLGAAGARLSYSNLAEADNKFLLDINDFIKEDADIAVIDTPNNPTGSLLLDEDKVPKLAERYPALLIDEAYGEFAPFTLTGVVEEYDNVIVTRTMSKAFALAGFRIGFLVSTPKNVTEISKMVLPYDIPAPTVEAALAAFSDISYAKKYVEYVNDEKKKLYDKLSALGWKPYESYTNFVLVKAVKGVVDEFKKRSVMVRRVPLGDEWFRVSIGSPEEMELFYTVAEEIAKHIRG